MNYEGRGDKRKQAMKLGKFLFILGILWTLGALTNPPVLYPDPWSTTGKVIGAFAPGIVLIWYGHRRMKKIKQKQQETEQEIKGDKDC
jgi:membrane associated rhomboid family serine protease